MANGSPGVFGAIQAQLDSLSPRDRKLLAGLAVFAAVIFVGFLTLTVRGRIEDKRSRVMAQKEALVEMQKMESDYIQAAAAIETAQTRLREYADQPLSAYMEKTASAVGVREALSVSKQSTEEIGGVEQTRYKIELKRVPYDDSLNFLWAIETEGYPLRIESSRFKVSRVKGERVLTVTIDLVTYKLQETG